MKSNTFKISKTLLNWGLLIFILFFYSCIETNIENPEKEDEEDEEETVVNVGDFTNSYAEALAGNYPIHERESDYSWVSSSVVAITLSGQSATVDGNGATVSGSTITIHSAGNYSLTGTLTNGQIVVETQDTATVRLILNNAEISNSAGIPVYIKNAEKAVVALTENSSNLIANKSSASDSTKAALYSENNLTICGKGQLTVNSNSSHGIVSSEGLIITSSTLEVTASGNGIKGKDYLVVKSGNLTVNAGGDGLKSDNSSDDTKGYVALLSGTININADEDAIDAQTDAIFVDGTIDAQTTGNKSSSAKGIKGQVNVIVESGNFTLNCADNAIHTSGNIAINGGTFNISTSLANSHGISSKNQISIAGGTIGIEVKGDQSKAIKSDGNITLSGGDITIATTGNVTLETSDSGYDPSYCTAIKGDADIVLNGSNVTITSKGVAGKGISADGNFTITSGLLNITATGNGATYKNASGTTDSYNATCISCDGNTNIIGGTITLVNSGSAGKGISSTGALTIGSETLSPVLSVTTTGSKITVSGSTSTGGNRPGGSGQTSGDYSSAKAIKSDSEITINSGNITVSSADDGIKSEKSVTINSGTVTVSKSTEGIEAPSIILNGGSINITASDDGLNATAGTSAGGTESNDGSILKITGGVVAVSTTAGDGLDSNGSLEITGGTVIVQGPQSQPELGMDVNGNILFSGGLIIISNPNAGNMIETPSTSSAQYSVKATSSSIGTNLFRVEDASGNALFTFKPTRSAYNITFSSPELNNGSSYSIYTGGSISGTDFNGYYSGGTYSGGSLKKTFSVSSKVTTVSF